MTTTRSVCEIRDGEVMDAHHRERYVRCAEKEARDRKLNLYIRCGEKPEQNASRLTLEIFQGQLAKLPRIPGQGDAA